LNLIRYLLLFRKYIAHSVSQFFVHYENYRPMIKIQKTILLIAFIVISFASDTFGFFTNPQNKIDSLIREGRETIDTDPIKARQLLTNAYELAIQSDELKDQANALNYLGLTWYNEEKYEEAIKYFQKSLKVLFQIGSKNNIANMMKKIGISYLNLDKYTKAIEYYNFAVKIYDQTGFIERKAQTLIEIGVIYSISEKYSKAAIEFDSALSIYKSTHNKAGISQALNQLGLVYHEMNNYKKASKYYQEALEIYEHHMDYSGLTVVLNNYGNTLMQMRMFDEARDVFEKATKHCDIKNKTLYAQVISNLAGAEINLKNYTEAARHLEQAKILVDSIQADKVKAQVYRSLYELSMHQNNPKNALEYYQQYIAMKDTSHDKDNEDVLASDSGNTSINNFAITVTVLAVLIIIVLVIWLITAIRQRDKAVAELKRIQQAQGQGFH
jgi:tetratricopeptide (TPR) repeat protein